MRRAYAAITVWQPWASLIAYEAKVFEFRGWRPAPSLIGQRIAIHAAARAVNPVELRALLVKLHSPAWRETGILGREAGIKLLEAMKPEPWLLPRSAVVCVALLGKPLANAELAESLGVEHVNDSDRDQHANIGWPLSDVCRLEPPVPARGNQGFWTWHGEERCAA